MLESNMSGSFTDLWALGCIIYQMLEGKTPFEEQGSSGQVYDNIMQRNFSFPMHFDEATKDLINKLLAMNPYERIGYNGY